VTAQPARKASSRVIRMNFMGASQTYLRITSINRPTMV
jgi:hypothetical protein